MFLMDLDIDVNLNGIFDNVRPKYHTVLDIINNNSNMSDLTLHELVYYIKVCDFLICEEVLGKCMDELNERIHNMKTETEIKHLENLFEEICIIP